MKLNLNLFDSPDAASPLIGQDMDNTIEIERTPNVNWWAGIIREGHKCL